MLMVLNKSIKRQVFVCALLSCCMFTTAVFANTNASNLNGTSGLKMASAVIPISGRVTDATNGDPLIGATILVKGTSTGTTTDFDGNFSLDIEDTNVSLVVSFTGYQSLEVEVGNRTSFDIALAPDVALIDEVVVVGYGTQKKREVTGAIASLSEEAISKIPVSNGVQAMQGQVAGVDIQAGGGRPGQAAVIRIRGRRSISASNDPLYVIDGIPQISGGGANSENPIADINPQDIQSIEVLKDAAATAIYGSRGANGVVLISTKRGNSGKSVVSYDGYYGVTEVTRRVDMMNGEEFAALKRESRRAIGLNAAWNGTIPSDDIVFDDPTELESIALGRSVDYQDLILDDGWQMNHQVSMRGGSDKTLFNVSLGYFDEQGIIRNMDYNRLSARVNLDHTISKVFKTGVSLVTARSIQNWGSSATLGEALANNPLGQPYNEDGTLRFLPTNDGIRTNPLNEIVDGAFIDERRVTRIFAPVYLEVNFLDGLQFRVNAGPDVREYRRGQFRGSLTNDNRGGPADAEIEQLSDYGFTLENLLTYSKTFGDHNLKLTGLQSIQTSQRERHYTAVANLPYESQQFYNIGTAEVKGNLASGLTEWALASWMGRINYEFKGKYLFQASYRADGSSRLAEGNKWAGFPGVSVGWRIADEPFMAGAGFFDDLKLRASYGEVGNTSVNPYQTAGRLNRRTYAWDETPAFGFGLNEIPNPDLGWEVSKTLNVGLDFDILSGRVAGSIEWYRTQTTDILLNRFLPPTSGYASILQNIGATQSTGVELGLNAGIVNTTNFRWDVNLNIAGYREEITELALKDENGNSIDDIGNRWFIGQPIKVWFDYRKIGIWQADEADQAKAVDNRVPGEVRVEDVDGDGKITPDDRVILGTDVPDYFGGLTNNFSFKGFDLSVFFYFRVGQTVQSDFHRGNNSLFARYNNLNVDYWTPDNPTNEYPRPNQNQEFPIYRDALGIFDGSYWKLRNVTLGYNLPSSIAQKLKMSSLRLYASGQNLWFSSKFDTFDPEVSNNDDQDLPVLGAGTTPSTKLILFGINAKF